MKVVGKYWNDKNLDIVEVNGEYYVINDDWNGEHYFGCWKVLDVNGIEKADDNSYILTPKYMKKEDDFEIVDYEVATES